MPCHDVTCCITIVIVTPGLSSGKTVWSTTPAAWSGKRRLDGREGSDPDSKSESTFDSAAVYVVFEAMSVHRSLYTTQPSWCSFQEIGRAHV